MQSWIDPPHACPRCKWPVTLGGGRIIEKFFDLFVLRIGSKSLFLSQNAYRFFSTKLKSYAI
jgi:hypothetical protein